MWTNYTDVQDQLRATGLTGRRVDALEVTGKIVRTQVEDDREERGWYVLHEIRTEDGTDLLVGSFGVWRGNDKGARKIGLRQTKLSDEARETLKAKYREDRRRAEAVRAREAERAARRAELVWRKCLPDLPEGGADYLKRKGIGAHGVRFSPQGAIVLAMHDAKGRVHGLQFILSKDQHKGRISKTGRDKEYWPKGLRKEGHWFQIGAIAGICLICEGYATGASLHEATGLPVAVAFDAGNLRHVAKAIRHAHPRAKILLCADDDFVSMGNPGITSASSAALEVSGAWIAPVFRVDDQVQARTRAAAELDWTASGEVARTVAREIVAQAGRKLTDFNDLHAAEGLLTVRAQIEARLSELGWSTATAAPTPHLGGEGRAADDWRFDIDVLRLEFSLIYGTDTVFDHRRRLIIGLGPLRSAAGKALVREWLEHPDRQTVLPEQVGFDPARTDPEIKCNLWSGWPTRPARGCCDRLLELLEYLCQEEKDDPDGLYRWILKWLAYPIQNPGAKMQTALLIHGPEGTGKNTFFGAIRKIYGRYACQFSQVELEEKFNGWASGKLFAIGNEVVSRAEMYHLQGRLKTMITENEWMINEKNLPARSEQNHCNFVFFSNRVDIAKLDDGDRRYCVVWTPPALGADFYREVSDEIAAGGVEALHDYLLNLDLTGFNEHAKPPKTRAKAELVELSMDSTERFFRDWTTGRLGREIRSPCLSSDLYELYKEWARREGLQKFAQRQTLLTAVGKHPGVIKRSDRYILPHTMGPVLRGTVVYPPGTDWEAYERLPKDGKQRWIGAQIKAFVDAWQSMKESVVWHEFQDEDALEPAMPGF